MNKGATEVFNNEKSDVYKNVIISILNLGQLCIWVLPLSSRQDDKDQ